MFEPSVQPKINLAQTDMSDQTEIHSLKRVNADTHSEAYQFASGRVVRMLRVISVASFGLAISSASIIVIVHLINILQPGLVPWTLKTAIPLILIGVAFASLQFALPRTRGQMLLGLMVALAFILWGT